jgi:glycosyltransferase involved in cell wall biosynthesis
MKVALFVHCFFPAHFYGTETYTLDLARNLLAMGHEPVVVSAVFQGEARREAEITSYDYLNIPVYCLDKNYYPHRDLGETYYQPNLLELHKQLLAELKPDVVHVTHLINHTAILLEAATALGIPTVTTLTDFFGICFNNRLEASDGALCGGPNVDRTNCIACVLKARSDNRQAGLAAHLLGKHPSLLPLLAGALNRASRLPGMRRGKLAKFVADIAGRPDILLCSYAAYRAAIAPTRFLMDAYMANGLTAPLHLMHFGVDVPRVAKETSCAGTPVRFGYIGQIAPHKGTDILIDAFARLPSGSAELHIYGGGQEPAYMSALLSKAEGHSVFFRGTFPKDQLANVFSGIDFLVIPSRWYENSPLVLLNSLAMHTPVIVSDVEGMTEFVKDGSNGFVFCRGGVDDLARVLYKIIQSPLLLGEMSGQAGYERTTRMMTEEVFAVYESVLASKK